jgi:hypothetical protein
MNARFSERFDHGTDTFVNGIQGESEKIFGLGPGPLSSWSYEYMYLYKQCSYERLGVGFFRESSEASSASVF